MSDHSKSTAPHAEAEGAQAVQDTWQAQAERGDAQFKELLTRHAALEADYERAVFKYAETMFRAETAEAINKELFDANEAAHNTIREHELGILRLGEQIVKAEALTVDLRAENAALVDALQAVMTFTSSHVSTCCCTICEDARSALASLPSSEKSKGQ